MVVFITIKTRVAYSIRLGHLKHKDTFEMTFLFNKISSNSIKVINIQFINYTLINIVGISKPYTIFIRIVSVNLNRKFCFI